jgi:hypothetical protein
MVAQVTLEVHRQDDRDWHAATVKAAFQALLASVQQPPAPDADDADSIAEALGDEIPGVSSKSDRVYRRSVHTFNELRHQLFAYGQLLGAESGDAALRLQDATHASAATAAGGCSEARQFPCPPSDHAQA